MYQQILRLVPGLRPHRSDTVAGEGTLDSPNTEGVKMWGDLRVSRSKNARLFAAEKRPGSVVRQTAETTNDHRVRCRDDRWNA